MIARDCADAGSRNADDMDRLRGSPIGGLTEEEPMQAADCVIQPHMISDSRRSASS